MKNLITIICLISLSTTALARPKYQSRSNGRLTLRERMELKRTRRTSNRTTKNSTGSVGKQILRGAYVGAIGGRRRYDQDGIYPSIKWLNTPAEKAAFRVTHGLTTGRPFDLSGAINDQLVKRFGINPAKSVSFGGKKKRKKRR